MKSAPDTQAVADGQTLAVIIVKTNIDQQTAALGAAALTSGIQEVLRELDPGTKSKRKGVFPKGLAATYII
ncbi:MAG: hypothetical protein PVF37_10800 [Desulfobacterales bacterium]